MTGVGSASNGTVSFTGSSVSTYAYGELVGDGLVHLHHLRWEWWHGYATVTVTVNAVNDPPDAVNDSRTINEDASLTFDPRGNDTDPDGLDPASVTVTGGPSNGTVSFTGTSVSYVPNANFFGTDSFTYAISDGNGGTDTATVSVTVDSVNDGPNAVDDVDSVNEDSSVTVDVLGNDTDIDDGPDPASVNVTSGPSNGSTSVNPDGSIDYTPDPDFFGIDSFSYGCVTLPVTVTRQRSTSQSRTQRRSGCGRRC